MYLYLFVHCKICLDVYLSYKMGNKKHKEMIDFAHFSLTLWSSPKRLDAKPLHGLCVSLPCLARAVASSRHSQRETEGGSNIHIPRGARGWQSSEINVMGLWKTHRETQGSYPSHYNVGPCAGLQMIGTLVCKANSCVSGEYMKSWMGEHKLTDKWERPSCLGDCPTSG